MKTWISAWKNNGFFNTRGKVIKNADIIRCTSIQLDIRASYPQKVHLQYVKDYSGDVGTDGVYATIMANRGTLWPAVEDRDWEALATKLSDQLEKSSDETSGEDPAPMEVDRKS